MLQDQAIKADYYRYGIELGILGFEKAMVWADKIIALESEPDVEIIDVALASPRGRNGVMDALKAVKGVRDPQLAGKMLLRDLQVQLQNGCPLKAISRKASMVTWVTQMPEAIRWQFDRIDDDISLAEQGIYDDVEHLSIELNSILTQYQFHDAT